MLEGVVERVGVEKASDLLDHDGSEEIVFVVVVELDKGLAAVLNALEMRLEIEGLGAT